MTQSHCGCSDIVIKNFKHNRLDFTFYYGGGLFRAGKYIYPFDSVRKETDTLIYIPITTNNYTIPFDSLDKIILQRIDTLITNKPTGSGLIYDVKRHDYKGFVEQKSQR